mgnify:CR=1 FL=1
MKLLLPAIFLLLFHSLLSQERIVEEYPDIFVRAAEERKSVFFIFSSDFCGWCRVFEMYHASPEVKKILEKDYLFETIDITAPESESRDLWKHYEFIGIPAWLIFSSDKEMISDGRNEDGEPLGYPLSPGSMDAYIDAIKRSSRHIKKKQLLVLREKIVYCDESY